VPDLDLMLLENRIDRLLDPWRQGVQPGMSIGVVRKGQLVAQRHAGFASIEHRVPLGPHTRFRVASVSKQFTCAAVLLLAERGLLAIDTPITMLLPDMPAAYADITVAHLMHNTSGIRDMLEIQRQGGADLGTPLASADLLDGILRQRTVNFAPGTRYLYSNSNFLLLGRLVEQLTGMTLAHVLETEIFAPLGMHATAHIPDPAAVLPHLATGYLPAEAGGFVRAAHAFPIGGEGGLVSTVTDLALWARNAALRRVPSAGVLDALEVATPFVNGTMNLYRRGLIGRSYRGVHTVSHSGLWPGLRTEFLRVPEREIAVIAIANHAGADPGLAAHQVLDVMLDATRAPRAPTLPPRAALLLLAGRYMHPATGATLDLGVDEAGRVSLATHGQSMSGEPTPDGRLAVPRSSSVFAVRAIGADAVEVELDAGAVEIWQRVPDRAALPADLPGRYHSAEMATDWTITRHAEGMVARADGPVARGPDWPISAIGPDDIRLHLPTRPNPSWLDVRIKRDCAGSIVALVASGSRARFVHYTRRAET
jgi:CubicO group peptidase (beta-lactamase class C family)